MQDETPIPATNPAFGRSTVAKLPKEMREAVDQAIADGATIDGITARIRAEGEECSRSAVGRYAKDMRELMHRQQEADRMIKTWMQEFGERPQGQSALVLIESLRAMVFATMGHLGKGGEPVSTEELARLSLMLKRIESTDKLRVQREQAAQKAAEAAKPKPRRGLSPEMVARIDEAVLGKARWPVRTVTSVPIDPWNPDESPLSRLIPDDPGESRPEIAPGVFRTSPTSVLSLGPGGGAGARSARRRP